MESRQDALGMMSIDIKLYENYQKTQNAYHLHLAVGISSGGLRIPADAVIRAAAVW